MFCLSIGTLADLIKLLRVHLIVRHCAARAALLLEQLLPILEVGIELTDCGQYQPQERWRRFDESMNVRFSLYPAAIDACSSDFITDAYESCSRVYFPTSAMFTFLYTLSTRSARSRHDCIKFAGLGVGRFSCSRSFRMSTTPACSISSGT
uniref:Uncharacterized protein n=1 Tax=Anopheles coluzzii TaxID=1518534 RepID=A0A8W7PJ50_ANOCL